MSIIDKLIELTRQSSFYDAGGGNKTITEGLDQNFDTVNKVISNSLALKKADLENKKLSHEIDGPRLPYQVNLSIQDQEKAKDAIRQQIMSKANFQLPDSPPPVRPSPLMPEENPVVDELSNVQAPTSKEIMVDPKEMLQLSEAEKARKERPQSDFTPFMADDSVAKLTGGKIPKGTMTNMAMVKQYTAGDRADAMATGLANRQQNTFGQQEHMEQIKSEKIPPGQAGLATLANESVVNISDLKKILFPDGTPNSFRRDIALKSNLPLIGPAPFDKDAQNVARKIGSALAARQLIQTGVAARPDETKALVKNFAADYFSDPQAASDALDQLANFYSTYINTVKTRGKNLDTVQYSTQTQPTDQFKVGEMRTGANGQKGRYMGNGKWLVVQ